MAVLSDNDRKLVNKQFQEFSSGKRDPLPVLKSELKAAVDAIDDWVNDNSAAYNSAIPQPVRGALTAKQKANLLVYVVTRRYEVA